MKTIILFFLALSQFVLANPLDRSRRDESTYQAEGRLVLFQVKPGDGFMRVYLVGKEAAKVHLASSSKLVTVTLFQKGKVESVPFKSVNDYYKLETVPQQGPYDLEIKATVDGKPDTVRFSIGKP